MDPGPVRYAIRIKGHLGATLLSAFPALASRQHGAHTVLTGPLDQSALFGVLAGIEALGLELIEVRQLTAEGDLPIASCHSSVSCSSFLRTTAGRAGPRTVPRARPIPYLRASSRTCPVILSWYAFGAYERLP
jgi:hypothetical protein